MQRAETEKVRRAVREIGDVVYRNTGTMKKLFKEFCHMTHKDHVTCEQIHAALRQLGHHLDIEDVQRCIVYVLPGVDLDAIDYIDFEDADGLLPRCLGYSVKA